MKNLPLLAVVSAWLVMLASVSAVGTDEKGVTVAMCRAGGGDIIAGAVGTPGYCLGGTHDGKQIFSRVLSGAT